MASILKHLPKNLQLKIVENYEEAPDHKKTHGRSRGIWMRRKDKEASKRSAWLFKSGGGLGNLSKIPAGEIHAIREAYAGAIYQLFIPEHTPKTRLVLNTNAEQINSWKYSAASKEIKSLMFLPPEKINQKKFIDKYKIQVAKVFILSVILGEIDFSFSNCALAPNEMFIKIDHGETFAFQDNGEAFVKSFNIAQLYNSSYWSRSSMDYLNEKFFTPDVIQKAIDELVKVDLDKVDAVADQYEPLLSTYRNTYKEKSYYLLGNSENKIKMIVMDRLKQLHMKYLEKENNLGTTKVVPKI